MVFEMMTYAKINTMAVFFNGAIVHSVHFFSRDSK